MVKKNQQLQNAILPQVGLRGLRLTLFGANNQQLDGPFLPHSGLFSGAWKLYLAHSRLLSVVTT